MKKQTGNLDRLERNWKPKALGIGVRVCVLYARRPLAAQFCSQEAMEMGSEGEPAKFLVQIQTYRLDYREMVSSHSKT